MFFLLPQLSSPPVPHQALSKFTRAVSSRFPWSRTAACPPRVIKTNDTLLFVVRDVTGPLHGEKVLGEGSIHIFRFLLEQVEEKLSVDVSCQ